jgi:hypothetical protein
LLHKDNTFPQSAKLFLNIFLKLFFCSRCGIRTRTSLINQGRYPKVVFIPTYAKRLANKNPLLI